MSEPPTDGETGDENDYTRPSRYDLIDPSVTHEQARAVKEKIMAHMQNTGMKHIVSVMQRTGAALFHVRVTVDQPLKKALAPPETVDGVYIAINRIRSIDDLLNGQKRPPPRPGPGLSGPK